MSVEETEANKAKEQSKRPTQWDLAALQTASPWKRGGGRERVCERKRASGLED